MEKEMSYSVARFLKEIWAYMKVRKKWWLLPIVVMSLLVGLLIVFGQSSPMAPFLYPIF